MVSKIALINQKSSKCQANKVLPLLANTNLFSSSIPASARTSALVMNFMASFTSSGRITGTPFPVLKYKGLIYKYLKEIDMMAVDSSYEN